VAPDPHSPQHGLLQDPGAASWAPPYSGDQTAASVTYGDSRYARRYDAAAQQATPPVQTNPSSQAYPSPYDDPRHAAAPYADGQAAPYADGQYDDPRYAADPRYDDPRYADPGYAEPGEVDPRYADPRYADSRYAEPRFDDGAGQGYADPRYPDPNFGGQGYAAPAYAAPDDGYPQSADQGYSAYAQPNTGQYQGLPPGLKGQQPYADPYYPPQPSLGATPRSGGARAKRHGGMVTVLAVLALAVVGTAAAFGYRAMFSGAGAAVPPPVIKADVRPSKVVPATDPNNKPIQDRIGVKTEKIVPRQEEPVQQAAPGQPRVISPWLAGQNPQAFPPASANVAPTGSTLPSGSEPKRIRTVPIKPQQGTEAPAARNTRSAGPAGQPAEADQAHTPLALSPTGAVPQRQAAARQAHAALAPSDTGTGGSPFPTPLPASAPSAPSAPTAGPYAVQVTSQRSEADAQASFRSLQQQFPSVLGNRQPLIRRADLGERGTYYRAQIPFSSQSAASEFCSSLKAAGGQCVVARN
jgi:hypothetical protein